MRIRRITRSPEPGRRLGRAPAAALVVGVTAGLLLPMAPVSAKPGGEVFVVQGVVGSTWEFSIDGDSVGEDVAAKEILGGFDLAPGEHEVSATNEDGDTVEAMVDVRAGESLDVVLHLPVDAGGQAVMTSFVNDTTSVATGNSRLSIAHTAAVGPADIKVDGKVLFSDVASGEELTVVVPADTYEVAVVPAATADPPVLGPVDLPVNAGQLTRVFAVGVAERGTMDAVVHTLAVPETGSAAAPGDVPGGTGGQHDSGTSTLMLSGGLAALVGSLLLALTAATRRRAVLDRR